MNNSSTDYLPACSRIVSTFFTTTVSFLSIASFIGNSLVTITFLLNRTLRTSTNYFLINMAFSDVLSSSTNWPLSATEGLLSKQHMIRGQMASFLCKLGHYTRAISQAVSVLSLLLIVVDRYIAIVLPLKSILITKRCRAALLLSSWMFSLVIAFPYVWSSKIIHEGHQTFCRTFVSWGNIEKSIFYGAGFLIFYCIPFISIITLYSRITKRLRRTRRDGQDQEQDNTRVRNLHQNRVVMKAYVWIVSAFFICWTPLCVHIVLKKFLPASMCDNDPCMLLVGLLFYVCPTLSTVLNPVILFASSSRFSQALKEMFRCFTCHAFKCCKNGRVSPQHEVLSMQVS